MKRYDQAGKAKWLILVIAAGILLLGVILYAGGRWLETRSVEEARGDLTQTEAVETQEYNGVTYQRREGLTSILVMGVDHDSAVESEGAYQGGQGDFQRLIVIDPERQVIRQLKIDRDTMTECTVLGYLGSPIGTKEMQISLAHGFGDGKEESCEYAREAVEDLLLGESIDFYVAMNMDGISELNDLAGGVTVTLEDDFSSIDPAPFPPMSPFWVGISKRSCLPVPTHPRARALPALRCAGSWQSEASGWSWWIRTCGGA